MPVEGLFDGKELSVLLLGLEDAGKTTFFTSI
jgi:GTPase SAR1 family protein